MRISIVPQCNCCFACRYLHMKHAHDRLFCVDICAWSMHMIDTVVTCVLAMSFGDSAPKL